MDTPLSLEIDDGCKLDNLVCEIDKKFNRYMEMGEHYEFLRKTFLPLQYFKKALKVDPDCCGDTFLKDELNQKIKSLTKTMIKLLIKKADRYYENERYNISLFYFSNALSYIYSLENYDDTYLPYKCEIMIKEINSILQTNNYIDEIHRDGIHFMNNI
tara:strand:+ start:1198 stop:1671 length:474 start_codon:yes stop_codon:yes gene_type:complete